ncbi:nodulation protein NodH [Jannaschia sp. Os4]|uniref:nodulation protein NodH n=1 Tax=Jannaschia sp. Os4 TaxID=2807617 RepID=UPI001939A968|nr:nodulation protein NodH [Jannaschia sp. Os4]MBM2575620.1 nodulation protein NodH [Jannaschia sp. Os4]
MSFRGFVLFAEMRTGSNHLEESLGTLPDVTGHGEAFNPVFLGAHNRTELHGIDMAARDADPVPLLRAILDAPGITGFRFFHDHDPRVLDPVLRDRTVAKVILSRNAVDSYVSLRIASETGQWRLTNPKMAKDAKVAFDGGAFDEMLARQAAFRGRVHRTLQETGQAPFLIDYADIGDVDVVNGVAAFLGSAHRLDALPGRLKRQNPGGLEDKLTNHGEMVEHVAGLDPFELHGLPGMDPLRGPSVPSMLAAAASPLLVLPLPGGPDLRGWLEALDGTAPRDGLNQRDLRAWLRSNKAFEALAVPRHPLLRAWHLFEARLVPAKGGAIQAVRQVLARHHGVEWGAGMDERSAFAAFLRFLRDNLGGRSGLPVDALWASQTATLQGMASVMMPTRVVPEDRMADELEALAARLGRPAPPRPAVPGLPDWVDDEVAGLAVEAYRRDYLSFGFRKRP